MGYQGEVGPKDMPALKMGSCWLLSIPQSHCNCDEKPIRTILCFVISVVLSTSTLPPLVTILIIKKNNDEKSLKSLVTSLF